MAQSFSLVFTRNTPRPKLKLVFLSMHGHSFAGTFAAISSFVSVSGVTGAKKNVPFLVFACSSSTRCMYLFIATRYAIDEMLVWPISRFRMLCCHESFCERPTTHGRPSALAWERILSIE